jgi:hypothetical protein
LSSKDISIKLFKLLVVFISCFFVSGYGYNGNLPELGKQSGEHPQNNQKEQTESSDKPAFPAGKLFFPRMYSNYNVEKYSDYSADIKDIERNLVSLKDVLQSDSQNKVQKFCAKVNVLHLYIENLKVKYANSPERNYQSFKQLVVLDRNLMEAANYKRQTDKYRSSVRGSLASKLEDEAYLRQKIANSLVQIQNVLEIIASTN